MSISDLLEQMESKHGLMTFGSILKAFREAEAETQTVFAKRLRISQGSLADLETGRRIPTPTRAAEVARKLKVGEETLIFLSLRDYLRQHGFDYKITLEKAAS